jgi:dephospho-CoA kinase
VFALAFRDWLRAEPAARAEYAEVKQKASAAAAGFDREEAVAAYLAVKEPWFDGVYQRVLTWRAAHPE